MKKGQLSLGEMPQVAIMMVLIAAIFVAGFLVVGGLGASTTDTDATNAVNNVTEGLSNIVEYAPTWGVIIGVAVLLGIVLLGFGFARNRGML